VDRCRPRPVVNFWTWLSSKLVGQRMTTLPLLAHKMDRNPFAGVCQRRDTHRFGPRNYSGKQKRRKSKLQDARTARFWTRPLSNTLWKNGAWRAGVGKVIRVARNQGVGRDFVRDPDRLNQRYQTPLVVSLFKGSVRLADSSGRSPSPSCSTGCVPIRADNVAHSECPILNSDNAIMWITAILLTGFLIWASATK
jgi:hypothetical protein